MSIRRSHAARAIVSAVSCAALITGVGQLGATAAVRPEGSVVSPSTALAGGGSGGTPQPQYIWAFSSGLIMTVDARPRAGALVVIDSGDGLQVHRAKFRETWLREPDGAIRLAQDHGLCLSLEPGRHFSHVPLILARCHGSPRQRFSMNSPSAHTPLHFIHLSARRSLCLDAAGLDPGQPWDSVDEAVVTAPCSQFVGEAWSTADLNPLVNDEPQVSILGSQKNALSSWSHIRIGGGVSYRPLTNDISQYWELSQSSYGDRSAFAFSPIANTDLCLTVSGAEAAGAGLALKSCRRTGAGAQQYLAILRSLGGTIFGPASYWVATADGRFCVDESGHASRGRVVLSRCAALLPTTWTTWLPLAGFVNYLGFWYGTIVNAGVPDGMTAPKSAAGGPVVFARLHGASTPYQVWTEITPGSADPGNPDGSITLRPLSDLGLCLTVPGTGFPVNVPLRALPCNGSANQEFLNVLADNQMNTDVLIPFLKGSLCVSLQGASASVTAVLNRCTGFRKQRWAGLSFPVSGPIRIGPYTNGNAPLGVSGVTATSGQASLQPLAFGQPNQVWIKTATTGGYLLRWGYNAGWCLDTPQVAAGQPLTVQQCDGSQNQVFVISNDGGYPEMFHPAMDQSLCLAAVPPSVSETVTLQVCDATNSDQIWWYYHTD